jgi:hypothetical protein
VRLSRLAVLMNTVSEQDRIRPVASPRSSGT